jgi:hypothetical protein
VSIETDAAATRLDLVLSVDRGTLTLGTFAGLEFSGGTDGTNDSTIRFGGSPAAVAAALASLTFRPPTDASGAATIMVSVSDAGLGGPASSATIALTILAVNDTPVAGPPPKPLSVEAGSFAPVGADALAATDVDDGPEQIVYELAEASPFGDLRLGEGVLAAGARFTQADVDLGRVSFAARQAGTATVSLRLADAGGAMAGTTTLTFEVEPRPLAPVPEANVPEPAVAPPAPAEAVAALPPAAASPPTFVMAPAAPTFASLSSAAQSDGADAGSTRASVAQASQVATDGGGASVGLSAGQAAAQPAVGSVRVAGGGTGAVATGATAAGASATASPAAGTVQSGASAAVALQPFAAVAAAAGSQDPSGAGAQLGWYDAGSEAASEASGAGGAAGSSAGSGPGGLWTRARGGATAGASLPIDAWSPAVALRQADFRAELAQTREEAVARFDIDRTLVASSVAISTSLSIGYVAWLARGGVLLTSLLASMPAWRSIDPLPVLARIDARGRDDAENDDSLRGLLQRAADEQAEQAEQAERVAEAEALADRQAVPAGRLAEGMT